MFFATALGGAASLPHRGRQGMATLLQTDRITVVIEQRPNKLMQRAIT